MNRTMSILVALVAVLLIFLAVSWYVQSSDPENLTMSNPVMRFVFVIIGLLIAFAIYWFTQDRDVWQVGTREVVYMAIGAALYAIFSYLFNGTVFVVPSVSQVALRPAIIFPMFFGYTFGPVVGFFTGAVGNMFGDALTGFGVFPQWSVGNGLIGFIAGLVHLFPNKRRSLDILLGTGAALTLLVTLYYFLNRNTPNTLFFDPANNVFGDAPISLLAGLSLLIGLVLVAVVRYAFGQNIDIAAAVTWGMLGNIIGLLFAAISDIWINGYPPAVAIVGEFIPSAGPNLIFAAILLPLLVLAYTSVRRQSGR
jgi:uncharacterized membrane protein